MTTPIEFVISKDSPSCRHRRTRQVPAGRFAAACESYRDLSRIGICFRDYRQHQRASVAERPFALRLQWQMECAHAKARSSPSKRDRPDRRCFLGRVCTREDRVGRNPRGNANRYRAIPRADGRSRRHPGETATGAVEPGNLTRSRIAVRKVRPTMSHEWQILQPDQLRFARAPPRDTLQGPVTVARDTFNLASTLVCLPA